MRQVTAAEGRECRSRRDSTEPQGPEVASPRCGGLTVTPPLAPAPALGGRQPSAPGRRCVWGTGGRAWVSGAHGVPRRSVVSRRRECRQRRLGDCPGRRTPRKRRRRDPPGAARGTGVEHGASGTWREARTDTCCFLCGMPRPPHSLLSQYKCFRFAATKVSGPLFQKEARGSGRGSPAGCAVGAGHMPWGTGTPSALQGRVWPQGGGGLESRSRALGAPGARAGPEAAPGSSV